MIFDCELFKLEITGDMIGILLLLLVLIGAYKLVKMMIDGVNK